MKKNATPLQIFEQAMQLCDTKEEISELAKTFVVLGVAMLRGLNGHEFADSFFSGELKNTKRLVIKPEIIQ